MSYKQEYDFILMANKIVRRVLNSIDMLSFEQNLMALIERFLYTTGHDLL